MNIERGAGLEPRASGISVETSALAGVRFLRSFDGTRPAPSILEAVAGGRVSGVTLFRARNVESPSQVRELCSVLQAARPAGDPPLVIGIDQEGGQLQAVGEPATAWPGNLALGAVAAGLGAAGVARAEELARQAGLALGREIAALGGTLLYGPVCDVLHRSSATPLGLRTFGDDPSVVARLAAAMTEGIQAAGVIATLKHFPGHGAAAADSHRALPVIDHSLAELRREELPPFREGIAAGALAVLPGHLAVPTLTDGKAIPATFSRRILNELLRGELGFGGLTVSDALDMAGATGGAAGAAYGDGLGGAAGAAVEAGMDLLLLNHDAATEEAAFESLRAAIADGKLDLVRLIEARDRIFRVRSRLATLEQPSLDVVGCEEHRRLAREIADASVTLVRDDARTLALRAETAGRIAVLTPAPADLTPAETSSYLRIGLADALRARGLAADEISIPLDPTGSDVDGLVSAAAGYRTVIVCTFDAVSMPGQQTLVERLAASTSASRSSAGSTESSAADTLNRRLIAVALRSPYDVAVYPAGVTAVATYGIQAPQIEALADALTGRIPFVGRLPIHLEAAL